MTVPGFAGRFRGFPGFRTPKCGFRLVHVFVSDGPYQPATGSSLTRAILPGACGLASAGFMPDARTPMVTWPRPGSGTSTPMQRSTSGPPKPTATHLRAPVIGCSSRSGGALRVRDVRPQFGGVLVGDERGLAGIHPPALGKAAEVHGVKAELVVQAGNQFLGARVIPGQRERPAFRVASRVAVL